MDQYLKIRTMDSNSFESDFIKEVSIKDNMLSGLVFLPALNKLLPLEIDPEIDHPKPVDFDKLIKEGRRLIEYLHPESLQMLKDFLSREITESAYEQEDHPPTAQDFTALSQDLDLVKIAVFPNGFVLDYKSTTIFADSEIKVQLNQAFNVDDIAIYDE